LESVAPEPATPEDEALEAEVLEEGTLEAMRGFSSTVEDGAMVRVVPEEEVDAGVGMLGVGMRVVPDVAVVVRPCAAADVSVTLGFAPDACDAVPDAVLEVLLFPF
jgi:hypothetical protein